MKKKRTLISIIVVILGLFTVFHFSIMNTVKKMTNITVQFGSESENKEKKENIANNLNNGTQFNFAKVEEPSPFLEYDLFDEDAKSWCNIYDGYSTSGILVFDANGDEKLDVYFTQNGDNWTRPTDHNGVLKDKPYFQHNGLYINLGNDSIGNPIYKQAKYISAQNETFQEEELLIENFHFPRKSVHESIERVGRASNSAIAADLNNDGRLDLIVANVLPGMFWSHPNSQRVLGQFVRPVGRQAVNTKTPLSAQGMYFIHEYKANDQINDFNTTSRGKEAVGANSIFLNMGDKDHDGIPEWKDISRQSGAEGKRATQNILAADFDLDGDIDLFETNIMDHDYWPGGATSLAGAANQMYINQLSETGNVTFIEQAAAMDVDGLYDKNNPIPDYYKLKKLPLLPKEYSMALLSFEKYKPDFLEINGEKSEPGQISWSSVTQDVNDDGYPDIWVANDLGFLRLYINNQGEKFEEPDNYARSKQTGYWMSLTPGDFNGDLKEDLFAGNIGGASMNLAMPIPDPNMLFDPVMTTGTTAQQFFSDKHRSMHAFVDGNDYKNELVNKIEHSKILPPDASQPNNIRTFGISHMKGILKYDPNSIDPYEFAWGSTAIDIQNDGKQDIYWIGCLYGRGGGIFPIMGTGPGRLLVNASPSSDQLRFKDLTAEHHLFNIQELQYDKLKSDGFVYRKSPRQNWNKRSMVYSHDISVWGFQGPDLAEKITNRDLIQTAENGRSVVAGDLNNDGFDDIIVRNMGGYDSRSSNSVNLKAKINEKIVVIPAHDANFPSPTNFEAGSTRTFINTYTDNNWIKIKLLDDTENSFNRDAIGAKIIVNGKYVKVKRSGGGGFVSNFYGPLLFGLGQESASLIEIHWPDKKRTITKLEIPNYKNGSVSISKSKGILEWVN